MLCADLWSGSSNTFVSSVARQQPRFYIVGEVGLEGFDQPSPVIGIDYRKKEFQTLAQVALHPIGAAQVDFLVSAVAEVEQKVEFW